MPNLGLFQSDSLVRNPICLEQTPQMGFTIVVLGSQLRGGCTIGVIVYPSKADHSLRISWQESRKLLAEKPEM